MDEALAAARTKATTPRDAYELTKLEARAGNHGLLYVTNDKQANDAVRAGRLVTMRLELGDVVLIEGGKDSTIKGPFVGVLYEEDGDGGFSSVIVIDALDAVLEKKGKKETVPKVAHFSSEDSVVVWYRNGRPT